MAIYGLFVSLVTAGFFYAVGLVWLSFVSFFIFSRFFPFFLGAFLFSFISWFCIQWKFPLTRAHEFLIIFTLISGCLGMKNITRHPQMREVLRVFRHPKKAAFWLFSYIVLYGIVYIFLPLPNLKHYLPLTWTYNVDIFNYINVAQHLISPSANPHYFMPYYYQTPAVFYFYVWMSMFFQSNAMMACMPILYSTTAAIGLMIMYYCRYIFGCPRKIALSIAAVILCGSFYRYVIDAYFLSSLMGTVVWLGFLMEILKLDTHKSHFSQHTAIILVYLGLLLLLYPVLFVFSLIIFCVVMGFLLFKSPWRIWIKREAYFIGCLGLAALILCLILPGYIENCYYNLFEFVHRKGVLGFTLLSPASMLGFPSYFEEIPTTYIPLTLAFIFLVSGLLYALYLTKLDIKPTAYALLFLLIGAFGVYFLYYAIQGAERYQPWKFASYFIPPLAGVFWALIFRLKPAEKPFLGVVLFFIVANFLWVPIEHRPSLSKNYEKLALLNHVPQKEIYIKMDSPETTFLSVFFIRSKPVYLLSPSFYYYPKITMKNVPKGAKIFRESELDH